MLKNYFMRTSNIFVTVDAVILKKREEYLLLLIKRKNEPYKDHWALTGGFVDENEDLKDAAIRELEEETRIKTTDLKQIGAFGTPFRDPRGHTVAVAYFGIVPENTIAVADDDAAETGWFPLKDLPKLAFDHLDIVNLALQKFEI